MHKTRLKFTFLGTAESKSTPEEMSLYSDYLLHESAPPGVFLNSLVLKHESNFKLESCLEKHSAR